MSSFERFYDDEFDGQVRRSYLITGSNEAANDVVHDAMVKVYRRWDELDRPGAYLNRAVLNRCRDRMRRRRTAERSGHLFIVRESSGESTVTDHATNALLVGRLLRELPFNHRAALVMRFYGDMTTDEIADALDCRPGSVGPWINRGLAALRKELS